MNNSNISQLIFRVVPNFMSNVRCYIKDASGPNLGFTQFRILANIDRGTNTAKQIAELHGVSQPAISKTVETLVSEGFLTRHQNKNDRRCIKLKLTGKGNKEVNGIKSDASKLFEAKLNLLNKKEKLELVSALQCLESFLVKIQEDKS